MTNATARYKNTSFAMLPEDMAWLNRYRVAATYGGITGQFAAPQKTANKNLHLFIKDDDECFRGGN